MTNQRSVEEMIAWYAAGTLDEAGRRQVEEALGSSTKLDDLLEQARLNMTLADIAAPQAVLSPIHPRLLVDYIENPQSMPESLRRFIESEIDKGGVSRECLERLHEVEASLESAETEAETAAKAPSLWARLWSMLETSVLRPAPALAYLLVLAALIPFVVRNMQEASPEPAGIVRRVVLDSERGLRADGATDTDILEISGHFDDGSVLLFDLRTDLLSSDLERADLSYRSEVLRGSTTLWSKLHARDDFKVRSDGVVVLPLLIYPATYDPGEVYIVRIIAVAPGDPLDGEALYQRRFIIHRADSQP